MKIMLACIGLCLCLKSFSQANILVGSSSFITGGSNAYIVLAGDLRCDGTVNTSSASTWNFNGTTQQRITCLSGSGCTNIYNSSTYPVTVGNVSQNNSNGISVEVNTLAQGTHTFGSGATQIIEGIYWLTKTSSAYSGNNSTDKFFVTMGHGLLKQSKISTGRLFPVGSAATANDYTPVTVAYTGTPDNFSVRVFDNVYYSYNSSNGDPLIMATTNARFVKKTWIIKKDTRTTGDSFTPTLQWNAVNEDAAFTVRRSTDVTVARNHDGFWFPNTQGPASGSNPYTLSGTVTYDNAGWEYYPVSATAINTILAATGLKLSGSINGNKVQLQWSTLTEVNTSYFELQRSVDGVSFTKVVTVNASGNTSSLHTYGYADESYPSAGKSLYYCLKQVDKDGNTLISNIILITVDEQNNKITVYPNPAADYINIYSTGLNGDYIISLSDVSGKLIRSTNATLFPTGIYRMPCSSITSGSYIISLTNKLTKKHLAYHVSITH